MIEDHVKGVTFYMLNTETGTLKRAKTSNTLQIGIQTTRGLGAGANEKVGERAAIENKEEIKQILQGPRNDLPREYAPKQVISMLNDMKKEIYAVRGNCEAEVDQMVLQFPVMADYCILNLDGRTFYATHGHIYNENNLPPIQEGDILIHGHTHVLKAEQKEGYVLLNPGSVSIPKEGNPPTYAIFEDGVFTIKDFEGNIVKSIEL